MGINIGDIGATSVTSGKANKNTNNINMEDDAGNSNEINVFNITINVHTSINGQDKINESNNKVDNKDIGTKVDLSVTNNIINKNQKTLAYYMDKLSKISKIKNKVDNNYTSTKAGASTNHSTNSENANVCKSDNRVTK